MHKDYRKWHKIKTRIESRVKVKEYYTREIWWCSLGENIGVEIDGKNQLYQRPVLVLRKFNQYMFWAVPLSTQFKTGDWYFRFKYRDKNEIALLSQIRLISSKRLIRVMGLLEPDTFNEIKKLTRNLLE